MRNDPLDSPSKFSKLPRYGKIRKIKHVTFLICLFSSLLLQTQFIHPVNAAIRQVPTPTYPTIQSAIDAAKRNDIIQVAPGTYPEHLIVTIGPLTIQGANKSTTIIDAQWTGSPIDLQAGGITVTGFTITNGGRQQGIKSFELGDHNITDNIIRNNADGIYFSVSDSNIISGNTFLNNSMRGINLSSSLNTQIEGNTISESAYGMSLSNANSTIVTRNKISETSYGIYMTLSSQNTVTYNTAHSNSCGIQTAYSDHITINHNLVSGGMYGIQLYKTRDSPIANNTLTGTSYGMYLSSSNYNTVGGIRGNQISGNDWGLVLYNSTHNQIIDGNVIAENPWGIYIIAYSSTNTIYRNNFISNVRQAYQELGSTNSWSIGLEGNYWNDYGGYPPAEGVDYHPLSQPWPMRNIATTNVTTSTIHVSPGTMVYINVTVKNFGVISESFSVTAYYDSSLIGSKNATLAPGAEQTVTINWDTTGVNPGNYVISATAGPIPYIERDYSDNSRNDGTVQVGLQGDINGDHTVNSSDLALLRQAYGSVPGNSNWNENADLNSDGIIDTQDQHLLGKNYGQTA